MMFKMKKWALERKFDFKFPWSNKSRVLLRCIDDKCTWRLCATVVPHSDFFVVKNMYLNTPVTQHLGMPTIGKLLQKHLDLLYVVVMVRRRMA